MDRRKPPESGLTIIEEQKTGLNSSRSKVLLIRSRALPSGVGKHRMFLSS